MRVSSFDMADVQKSWGNDGDEDEHLLEVIL